MESKYLSKVKYHEKLLLNLLKRFCAKKIVHNFSLQNSVSDLKFVKTCSFRFLEDDSDFDSRKFQKVNSIPPHLCT